MEIIEENVLTKLVVILDEKKEEMEFCEIPKNLDLLEYIRELFPNNNIIFDPERGHNKKIFRIDVMVENKLAISYYEFN